MNKPVRILHVVPNMNSGGIENLIMNIYRNIDRDKVQFDFLLHHQAKSHFDDEIEKLGGKIYKLPVVDNKNVFKYVKDVNDFFSKHKEYKVVHGHMCSLAYIYLGAAKRHGVPNRIVHSHETSFLRSPKGYMKYIMFRFAKYNANLYYACSTEAGEYLFGKKRKFEIIPNAIDIKKFAYSEKTRLKVRKEINVSNDEILIGHVGRFGLEKNHEFLIEIFNEIHKKSNKYKLILIGDGELKEKIEVKVRSLNLQEYVIFTGVRDDVANLYQGMDIFLMPSFFEGLPLTGIEAQTAGLKCIFSDEITKEVKITNNVKFCSLKLSPKLWAEKVCEIGKYNRTNIKFTNDRFDIKKLAKIMQYKYENMSK